MHSNGIDPVFLIFDANWQTIRKKCLFLVKTVHFWASPSNSTENTDIKLLIGWNYTLVLIGSSLDSKLLIFTLSRWDNHRWNIFSGHNCWLIRSNHPKIQILRIKKFRDWYRSARRCPDSLSTFEKIIKIFTWENTSVKT